MKELLTALLNVQMEVSSVTKNANNPYFKSKYADYINIQEAVFPILHKHGILVMQPTLVRDGRNYVNTRLYHVATGQMLEADTEIIFKAGDAQAQGSGITYARRYGLMAILSLGADDDDANRATGRTIDKPQAQASKPQAQVSSLSERAMQEFEVEMTKAILELECCINEAELRKVWSAHRNLQGVQEFIDAKNRKKAEIA